MIAGFQTSFISVVLWPILSPQITQLAGILFALPLIYSFGRDWLVVSQLLVEESSLYRSLRQGVKNFFEGWLNSRIGSISAKGTSPGDSRR